MSKDSFLLLYKSLVRSHLEFVNSVWCPYKVGLIDELERVQRRATKLLSLCKNLDYENRLKFLNLPTLTYRRARGDMIQVYKILNKIYDIDVVPSLSIAQKSGTRGNTFKLSVARCKYDMCKYAFCNRIVHLWNSLPDDVVMSSTVISFKNNLDKFWKNDTYLFDYKHKFYNLHDL